jgi:vacuolar-type H+-ATPase subunit I/STV1
MKEKIRFALITIILGALGSGLWTYIGDPTVGWLGEQYIHVAQRLNSGYYDYLHSDIGEGALIRATTKSALTASLIYGLIMMIFGFMLKYFHRMQFNSHSLFSKAGGFIFFIAVVALLQAITLSVKAGYNRNAVIYLERSIEILSPSNDEKTILQLRAQYRSIENANDFYTLHDSLVNLANEKNVRLPTFEVAR